MFFVWLHFTLKSLLTYTTDSAQKNESLFFFLFGKTDSSMAAPRHMCVFKHTEICTLKVIDALRLKRMTKRDENKKKKCAALITVQSQYNVDSSKAKCTVWIYAKNARRWKVESKTQPDTTKPESFYITDFSYQILFQTYVIILISGVFS